MSCCDAVISMSAYEKDYLVSKGVPADKIHIVGNSILDTDFSDAADYEYFKSRLLAKYGITQSTKKIIFLGRKEPYKGIRELSEALMQIVRQDKDIDLCLFLVGPSTSAFEEELTDMKARQDIKIVDFGIVPEKEKHYLLQISDVLVLPSAFEAFGIVFLEAWKYKKPVIGSDRGAIPEVIKNAGLCVEYGNVRELAEKIKAILYDKQLAQKLGQDGKDKLEAEYSFEAVGKKVLSVYRHIVKRKKTILVVSHLFKPYFTGGSEIVAYYQSRRLKEKGFDVKVFAGRHDNRRQHYCLTREKGEFDIARVNLHDRDFDCYSMNYDKPELQKIFHRIIEEVCPDVVHFHNIYSFSLKMIEECTNAHIPTIMTLHDYWGDLFQKYP